ncbi:twitch domain-containing radical SAM protein [bacterium]|nr:twitch domain-containing radical SAM protein [bacterium]
MTQDNKVFCILPWIHTQIRQNGDVYPCCRVKHRFSYGSTLNNTMDQIWNSEEIKKVRVDMLAGTPQSFCDDCYTIEKLGSQSYRQMVNADFKDEFYRLEQTDQTGHLSNESIIYLDIRFSNVCNFKCRSCNPDSSNSWHDDYKKVHPDYQNDKRTHKLALDSKTVISDIEKYLPKIKKIYFAGGEPLLDENHYLLLEKLIELKRTDVELNYNTNLSHLNFKKWNAIALWKQFSFVKISASIDSIGPSLELIRKGAVWDDIKNNLHVIKSFLPTARLQIYPTLSVMNCYKITELIDYFLKKDFFKIPQQFEVNMLNDPDYINVSVLNRTEIDKLENHYKMYLQSITSICDPLVLSHFSEELERIIKFARHQDYTHLRNKFRVYTFILDGVRKEKTIDVLPELFNLLYE